MYKEDIEKLLSELDNGYVMTIHYEGFVGRGINGLSNNTIKIKDISDDDTDRYLYTYGTSDNTHKVNLRELELEDNYIKAKYSLYCKTRRTEGYILEQDYIMVVPYNSITSIRIDKIEY